MTRSLRKPAASKPVMPGTGGAYETALLECAAGSVHAISRIYVGEAAKMRRLAWRIVGDRDHADDVIHEAFAQILRDAKDFDPSRGSARAWVYTIVRHTALKLRRNSGREVTVDSSGPDAIPEQVDPSSHQELHAGGMDLRACLETLDPRHRASLIMAIIDGRTHAEIASYLGVPVGTVKSWIRRELIALRRRLE
jgi:RNA polymerase sigma-70 factor (ECF subfamily)